MLVFRVPNAWLAKLLLLVTYLSFPFLSFPFLRSTLFLPFGRSTWFTQHIGLASPFLALPGLKTLSTGQTC